MPPSAPSCLCGLRSRHSAHGPLLCCRRQPLPAVGAPMHDLKAAATPRQAFSYSPTQHLGAEYPPGLPLSCLATTTAATRAASPPGTTGSAGSHVGAIEDTRLALCWTFLGVGSIREPGLRLASLLLSSTLGTYQTFSHTWTEQGHVATELAYIGGEDGSSSRRWTCPWTSAPQAAVPVASVGLMSFFSSMGEKSGPLRTPCLCARKHSPHFCKETLRTSETLKTILWVQCWVQTVPLWAYGAPAASRRKSGL